MPNKQSLQPCPFCGGEVFVRKEELIGGSVAYFIECHREMRHDAKAFHATKDGVINSWNTRAKQHEANRPSVEEAVKKLCQMDEHCPYAAKGEDCGGCSRARAMRPILLSLSPTTKEDE